MTRTKQEWVDLLLECQAGDRSCRNVAGLILDEIEELQSLIAGYQHHLRECEQIAGRALEYPWFADDQNNFPGSTYDDGVCIGDHIGDSIVQELADAYTKLKKETNR